MLNSSRTPMLKVSLLALLLGACAPAVPAQPLASTAQTDAAGWAAACGEWDDWDKPGPPFRIHGNTWYVGTCGIAAFLVTGDDGHILIDGGTEAGAGPIAANIAALGFDIADVKTILFSHEHFDHVGGLAELQRLSGARLLSSPEAAQVMATGVSDPADPQAGMHEAFAPVRVDGTVAHNEAVEMGDLRLVAIGTPGHTPGAISWWWRSCDDAGGCRVVNYLDSLSPISRDDYRFSDHPEYVARFREGLDRLKVTACGIVMTPHPSASDLHTRIAAGTLHDPTGCRLSAGGIEARLDARLAKEESER